MEKHEQNYNILDWFKKVVVKNYANFEGRARRKEYWSFILVYMMIYLPLYIFTIVSMASENAGFGIAGILLMIFALGMFIPMELNAPLLVGGLISWFVSTRSKDKALNTARHEKGTLLASGFIAGGALMGVVSAGLRFGGVNLMNAEWVESNGAQWLGLVMYGAIIGYLIWDAMRAKLSK